MIAQHLAASIGGRSLSPRPSRGRIVCPAGRHQSIRRPDDTHVSPAAGRRRGPCFHAPDNGRWDNVVVDDEAGWSRDISIWGRLGGAI